MYKLFSELSRRISTLSVSTSRLSIVNELLTNKKLLLCIKTLDVFFPLEYIQEYYV